MAGDWLKIESSTPEKEEVLAITSLLGWDDPDMAVGKLFRLWRWFDQHTIDGNATRVTSALLDRIIGVKGFCEAVNSVGWLEINEGGVALPKFDRHNGNTAKNRALTAKRVASHKANAKSNGEFNYASVTKALPREEKRRVNTTTLPPGGFDMFWTSYPRKDGKANAIKAFQKIAPDDNLLAKILGSLEAFCSSDQWRRDGGQFVPHAATWLNQRRWEDEIEIKQTGLAWAQGAI